MKIDKNFMIPLVIIVSMIMIMIFLKRVPAFPMVLLFLMVLLPVLIIQQKSYNNWGIMFFFGFILTILCILIIFGVYALSAHYEWIRDFVLWPCE